jgi:hypothetical protein
MRWPTSCLLENFEQRLLRQCHKYLRGLCVNSSFTSFGDHAVWHRWMDPGSGSATYTVAGPSLVVRGLRNFWTLILLKHFADREWTFLSCTHPCCSGSVLRCAEGSGVLSSAWQMVFQRSATVREGEELQRWQMVGTIHVLNNVAQKSSSWSAATWSAVSSFGSLQSGRRHCDNLVFLYCACPSLCR